MNYFGQLKVSSFVSYLPSPITPNPIPYTHSYPMDITHMIIEIVFGPGGRGGVEEEPFLNKLYQNIETVSKEGN